MSTSQDNNTSPSYQAMYREVESIIQGMQAPDLDLDILVQKVERGYELIKTMNERLAQTKSKIDEVHRRYGSSTEDKAPGNGA